MRCTFFITCRTDANRALKRPSSCSASRRTTYAKFYFLARFFLLLFRRDWGGKLCKCLFCSENPRSKHFKDERSGASAQIFFFVYLCANAAYALFLDYLGNIRPWRQRQEERGGRDESKKKKSAKRTSNANAIPPDSTVRPKNTPGFEFFFAGPHTHRDFPHKMRHRLYFFPTFARKADCSRSHLFFSLFFFTPFVVSGAE